MKKNKRVEPKGTRAPEGFIRAIRRAIIRTMYSNREDNMIELGNAFSFLSPHDDNPSDGGAGELVELPRRTTDHNEN